MLAFLGTTRCFEAPWTSRPGGCLGHPQCRRRGCPVRSRPTTVTVTPGSPLPCPKQRMTHSTTLRLDPVSRLQLAPLRVMVHRINPCESTSDGRSMCACTTLVPPLSARGCGLTGEGSGRLGLVVGDPPGAVPDAFGDGPDEAQRCGDADADEPEEGQRRSRATPTPPATARQKPTMIRFQGLVSGLRGWASRRWCLDPEVDDGSDRRPFGEVWIGGSAASSSVVLVVVLMALPGGRSDGGQVRSRNRVRRSMNETGLYHRRDVTGGLGFRVTHTPTAPPGVCWQGVGRGLRSGGSTGRPTLTSRVPVWSRRNLSP